MPCMVSWEVATGNLFSGDWFFPPPLHLCVLGRPVHVVRLMIGNNPAEE